MLWSEEHNALFTELFGLLEMEPPEYIEPFMDLDGGHARVTTNLKVLLEGLKILLEQKEIK